MGAALVKRALERESRTECGAYLHLRRWWWLDVKEVTIISIKPALFALRLEGRAQPSAGFVLNPHDIVSQLFGYTFNSTLFFFSIT